MPNTWATSDLHMGASNERTELMERPPYVWHEMLDKWNEKIAPDDLLLVLGDVADFGNPDYLMPLAGLNGRKWLFRGNHDRRLTDEQLGEYFERIFPEGQVVLCRLGGVDCALNHYPSLAVPDAFNLTGHIHSRWKVQKNMLNVGVDVHFLMPMNVNKIEFYQNAITNTFDEDVWVADHEANVAHASRGKAGNYFDLEKRTMKHVDMFQHI